MSSSTIASNLRLHAAAKQDSVALVNAALASGADVNARDYYGRTALHIAAKRGSVKVLEALLAAGAQVDLIADNGWCALRCAMEKGRRRAVETLLKASKELLKPGHRMSSLWYQALTQGNPAIVLVFIQAGVDINKPFGSEFPLTVAARFNHTAVITMLVEHGADVNAFNQHGTFVLATAACEWNLSKMSMLLDLGADPSLKDSRGFPALDWCILQGGHVPVLRRLLTAGACLASGHPTYDRTRGSWFQKKYADGIPTLLASGASMYELQWDVEKD
jgi:ankyrin repeat protein